MTYLTTAARHLTPLMREIVIPSGTVARVANICLAVFALNKIVVQPLINRFYGGQKPADQSEIYQLIYSAKGSKLKLDDPEHPLQKVKEKLATSASKTLWLKLVLQTRKAKATTEQLKTMIQAAPTSELRVSLYHDLALLSFKLEFPNKADSFFSAEIKERLDVDDSTLKTKQALTTRALIDLKVNDQKDYEKNLGLFQQVLEEEISILEPMTADYPQLKVMIKSHKSAIESIFQYFQEIGKVPENKRNEVQKINDLPNIFVKEHRLTKALFKKALEAAGKIADGASKLKAYFEIYTDLIINKDGHANLIWDKKIAPLVNAPITVQQTISWTRALKSLVKNRQQEELNTLDEGPKALLNKLMANLNTKEKVLAFLQPTTTEKYVILNDILNIAEKTGQPIDADFHKAVVDVVKETYKDNESRMSSIVETVAHLGLVADEIASVGSLQSCYDLAGEIVGHLAAKSTSETQEMEIEACLYLADAFGKRNQNVDNLYQRSLKLVAKLPDPAEDRNSKKLELLSKISCQSKERTNIQFITCSLILQMKYAKDMYQEEFDQWDANARIEPSNFFYVERFCEVHKDELSPKAKVGFSLSAANLSAELNEGSIDNQLRAAIKYAGEGASRDERMALHKQILTKASYLLQNKDVIRKELESAIVKEFEDDLKDEKTTPAMKLEAIFNFLDFLAEQKLDDKPGCLQDVFLVRARKLIESQENEEGHFGRLIEYAYRTVRIKKVRPTVFMDYVREHEKSFRTLQDFAPLLLLLEQCPETDYSKVVSIFTEADFEVKAHFYYMDSKKKLESGIGVGLSITKTLGYLKLAPDTDKKLQMTLEMLQLCLNCGAMEHVPGFKEILAGYDKIQEKSFAKIQVVGTAILWGLARALAAF